MMVDVRGQRDRGPAKAVKAMRQKVAASRIPEMNKKASAAVTKKKTVEADEV